jgi:hypothetical protein
MGGAETGDSSRTGKRARVLHTIATIALICVAVLPAMAAFVFLVALPAGRLVHQNQTKSTSSAERPATEARDPASRQRNAEFSRLRRDEAFWNARLVLAKQEAIGLAVDIVDSVASLEIRGVPVRDCKIRGIKVSRALRLREDGSDWLNRLSKPLVLQNEDATIPKEPIRVTEAPKDTIEAMKIAARPVPPDTLDVYFTFYFDGNLALTVRQFEKPTSEGSRQHTRLRLKEHYQQAKKAVMALVHSNVPQPQMRIEVAVSQEDAKAIYRALGPKAGLALRL